MLQHCAGPSPLTDLSVVSRHVGDDTHLQQNRNVVMFVPRLEPPYDLEPGGHRSAERAVEPLEFILY